MVRTLLRVLFAVAGWSVVVSVVWVLLIGIMDPPITWVMCQQAREQGGLEREWKDLDEIDRALPLAIIASEDQRFMTHGGFSWDAMRKAMDRNAKGRKLRGGSTLSQQTAKNVFLWPARSYLRKGLEAWFTLLMEAFWSKRRILEVYLNVAEMGRGVFGAEAAARHCFGIPASKLGRERSALLAVVLPSPRRYNCSRPGPYLRGRQQWTLRQMRNVGDVLDPEVLERRREKLRREEERRRKQR